MTKRQLLIGSVLIALAMISGAYYMRTHQASVSTSPQPQANTANDNSSKVTQPPVTDTPAPVGESPVSRPTPTPAQ